MNHFVLSRFPRLIEAAAKPGFVCRTVFIPTESPTHPTLGIFLHMMLMFTLLLKQNNQGCV